MAPKPNDEKSERNDCEFESSKEKSVSNNHQINPTATHSTKIVSQPKPSKPEIGMLADKRSTISTRLSNPEITECEMSNTNMAMPIETTTPMQIVI